MQANGEFTCDIGVVIKNLVRQMRALHGRFRYRGLRVVEDDGVYRADLGGRSWFVPTADRPQAIWVMEFADRHERFIDSLREGDVVFEVGATTGEYTIPAARAIGERGVLHAFEANPLVHRCLTKNIELQRLANVRTTNRAVSSESGRKMEFRFRNRTMAEASFHRDYLEDVLTVETISLDDYARSGNVRAPDVIKATVNGHELEVFKGAVGLLPTARNIVFQSAMHAEIVAFLSRHGYRIKRTFDVGARSELAILMERA